MLTVKALLEDPKDKGTLQSYHEAEDWLLLLLDTVLQGLDVLP